MPEVAGRMHQTAPRFWTPVLAVAIAALTFVAFAPALENQFLAWDDDQVYLNNPDFRGLAWPNIQWMFTTFHMGHYQPMTWLTLGLDYLVSGRLYGTHPEYGYGMDPRPFHFTNLLFHAINALLVYLLALRLLGVAIQGDRQTRTRPMHLAAALAALLFALHPLRVENVAWVTERRDLVSATFLLLTVLTYLRTQDAPGARYWIWFALSVILYVLSLMAKVSGVPLPVVLLALDWYPLRRLGGFAQRWLGAAPRRVYLEKIPFFAAALTFAIIATTGQSSHGWMFPLGLHPIEARIAQSFYGLIFYLWKTIAPMDLLPLYEIHFPVDPGETRFVIAFLMVVGLVALAIAFRRRAPRLLVAGLAYAAFLAPVLGLFQNGPQLVADRYSYLPTIGVMILLAGGVHWLWRHSARRRALGFALIACSTAALAALGILTWRQCGVWRTTESLWTFTLARDDSSSVANNGLGVIHHMTHHQPDIAIPYFKRAVEIDPFAKAYRTNLRNALRDAGRFQDVVNAWVDEARFGQFDATYHYDTGTRALNAGDNALALEHLTVAVALNPNHSHLRNNLAMVLNRLNRRDEAIAHYRKAIELDPNLSNARFGLALIYHQRGLRAEAIAELEALLRIAPNHASGLNLLQQLRQGAQPNQ